MAGYLLTNCQIAATETIRHVHNAAMTSNPAGAHFLSFRGARGVKSAARAPHLRQYTSPVSSLAPQFPQKTTPWREPSSPPEGP